MVAQLAADNDDGQGIVGDVVSTSFVTDAATPPLERRDVLQPADSQHKQHEVRALHRPIVDVWNPAEFSSGWTTGDVSVT
jgi:hypothetical protein